MTPLDDDLRRALQRRDPGPDFTARVLAGAAAAPRAGAWRRLTAAFRAPNLRWVAAATACLLMLAAGIEYRERETRIQGEAAKEQLVQALRIAGSRLNQARDKVRELNLPRREL